MKAVDAVVSFLLIVGGLNWFLVGIFEFDVVRALFGATILAKAVYVLVGLCAMYALVMWGEMRKRSSIKR